MGQISLQTPLIGQPNSTEDPKIVTDFSILQTWANGNIDATNISAGLAQSAIVNQSGQTVKGATNIPGPDTRTNTAFGTMPTADQVAGVVLASNGVLQIGFQGTWQESVAGASQAAIFIGSNQLQTIFGNGGGGANQAIVVTQAAATTGAAAANTNFPLFTSTSGLFCGLSTGAYGGDVTTGQILGGYNGSQLRAMLGTTSFSGPAGFTLGGPVSVFAAAGTYTVSVQYKSTSGSVTATNRKLWVQAIPFV